MTPIETFGWIGHILTVSHLSDSLTYVSVKCCVFFSYVQHPPHAALDLLRKMCVVTLAENVNKAQKQINENDFCNERCYCRLMSEAR